MNVKLKRKFPKQPFNITLLETRREGEDGGGVDHIIQLL
jgi:disulfide oxidoreductase YuzD